MGDGFGLVELEPGSYIEECEYGKAAEGAGGSSCWEGVVWACAVVAEDFGGTGADEECAVVCEEGGEFFGLAAHELEVFGGEEVADSCGVGEVGGEDGEAVGEGLSGGFGGWECGELGFELELDGGDDGLIEGDEDGGSIGVVLGLGEEVGGDGCGGGGGVGDEDEFGGAGEHIDAG